MIQDLKTALAEREKLRVEIFDAVAHYPCSPRELGEALRDWFADSEGSTKAMGDVIVWIEAIEDATVRARQEALTFDVARVMWQIHELRRA